MERHADAAATGAPVAGMAVRSGDDMTWEWVLTVDAWHAVVERVAGALAVASDASVNDEIARSLYESAYPEAMDARTCKEDRRTRWRDVVTRSSGHHEESSPCGPMSGSVDPDSRAECPAIQ
jgi:hypothetical protein